MESEALLLNDSPAHEDAFGPHQRIANSIRKLVATQSGGNAIALIGQWGAGKSTVIKLLCSSTDTNLKIFVFDAWTHPGDPLRRTFLEKLIAFLEEEKWITPEDSKKQRDALSGRYKESITTSTPQLTTLGIWCSLLLFVEAIGLAMISGGSGPLWWTILAFSLILAPVILMAIWYMCYFKGKNSDASNDVLSHLVNRHIETTKTAAIETPEPTSVEFQSWFYKLAGQALSDKRKLLLVIDNLDRVSPEDALQLWSAMRTFVDFSESTIPEWASRLWVMVAFDEHGINRLWGNEDPAAARNNGAESLATTFLAKTFQIRFRVPAPLLSDWRAFLLAQLKKAFADGSEDDFYSISQVYAAIVAEKRPPTPRDIKLFVNQISSTYLSSPEPIPLPQHALYALQAERKWNPSTNSEEFSRVQYYLGPDWELNKLALQYGMPRKHAFQVVLDVELDKAIVQGAPELIASHVNSPGIETVIDQYIGKRINGWRESDPLVIAHAAYVLSESGLTGNEIDANKSLLSGKIRDIPAWKNLDKPGGKGIAAALKQLNSEEDSRKMLSAISSAAPPSGESDPEKSQILKWLAGTAEVLSGLVELGQDGLIRSEFSVCSTPEDYLAMLAAIKSTEASPALWKYFRPKCGSSEIIQLLNTAVASGKLDDRHEAAVKVMRDVGCDWPWPQFSALSGQLQSNSPQPPDQIGRCTRLFLRLRDIEPFKGNLTQYAQSGSLFINLLLTQDNNQAATASSVLVALLCDPEVASANNRNLMINNRQLHSVAGRNQYRTIVKQPSQQKEILDALARLASDYNCIDELLACRKLGSIARPTIDEIISKCANGEKSHELFPPSTIIAHYRTIRDIDAKILNPLIEASVEYNGLDENLLMSSLTVENSGLYRQVLNIKRPLHLVKEAIAGLQKLSTDDWLETLNHESDEVIPLVTDLLEWEGRTLGLGHQLQDALIAFSKAILSNQNPSHVTPDICAKLLSVLTVDQQTVFRRRLSEIVTDANSSVANIITLFPDSLSDCHLLAQIGDKLVREGFKNILGRNDHTEYQWVASTLHSCPDLFNKCPKDVKDDFSQRVREKCQDGQMDPERKQSLNQIALILGVKNE